MFSEVIISALRDYRYLLDRGYPRKASLDLVGNKYQLTRTERSILYRGTSDAESASRRYDKRIEKPLKGTILIDVYNILFLIGNYLQGRPVFICDDGLLRDAGELRGRFSNKKVWSRALELLEKFMTGNPDLTFLLYIDAPVSNSGKLGAGFRNFMSKHQLSGSSYVCNSPDRRIVEEAGPKDIIATGDSVIIDQSGARVFDLSMYLLKNEFGLSPFNIHDVFKEC